MSKPWGACEPPTSPPRLSPPGALSSPSSAPCSSSTFELRRGSTSTSAVSGTVDPEAGPPPGLDPAAL
eukprot:12785467-Alexandrium_andersonii.AAC.1